MEFYCYIIMGVLLLPAMIFAFYAQYKVNKTYDTYSKVLAKCNLPANEVSRQILERNGATVSIMQTKGHLTDNYNPINKEICLSQSVYASTSVAAIGVAAHETGHALQDAKNYFPMKVRHAVIKLSSFASSLLIPLLALGTMFWFVLAGSLIGEVFIWVGVGLFALGALANLVTLPVEVNASNRALAALKETHLLEEDELQSVKKVLRAAALTYVASLAISLLGLLRILFFALAVHKD